MTSAAIVKCRFKSTAGGRWGEGAGPKTLAASGGESYVTLKVTSSLVATGWGAARTR